MPWLNLISWYLSVGLWFPKEYPSYTISDTSKYIREIGNIYIYIYINSPRWASHPTLLGLRKEQLQHLIVASCINLLQQKPWSLVMKVHSSLPTTLLGQNRNRWSYGHGQWAIASPFCHAPNPKGSKAWERHLKVPVDFSFLTIQSTKSYQVPTSKIIIIIPLNILSK